MSWKKSYIYNIYIIIYQNVFYIKYTIYTLPILDTLQKMTNSLLVNVDIPINTIQD